MLKRKPMHAWPYILDRFGIKYYDYGTLSRNGQKLFDYYKVDKITQKQRRALTKIQSDLRFKVSAPQFAPEMTSGLICIPKAAFYRLDSQQKESA